MPFDGQPSRGCRECRQRRVKCDQTAPACQRCCRAGRTCPGYQSRTDLVFRDMNHVAENKVMKRIKPTEGPGQTCSPECDIIVQAAERQLHDDIRFVYRPTEYVALSAPPGWEELAVTRFFESYTLYSDKFQDCWHFMPALCRRLKDCAHLKEALHAVAFRSQGNQNGMEWMVTEGRLAYGRALRLLAELSEDCAMNDSVLAAVNLIGMYETISGDNDPDALFPFHHYYGRSLLLRIRGTNQFSTPIQKSLFRVSLAFMVVKCIGSHIRPPEETAQWLELAGENDTGYRLARINIPLANLCADAQALFDSTVRNEDWILGLMHIIKEAIVLDIRFEGWREEAYEVWPYHKLRKGSPLPNASEYAPAIQQTAPPHIYHDIWVAHVWNRYRCCRLHLHEVLLHCLDLLHSHPATSKLSIDTQTIREQSASTIPDLLSDVCDSVPFCIGDIDSAGNPLDPSKKIALHGHLLIWPLYVISVSVEPDSIRGRWIRENLCYISNVLGFHKAQLLANRVRKGPWDLS